MPSLQVTSLASSFSKFDLPVTGMSWEIPKACANAAPLLAFTVPGKILNASFWSSSIQIVEGTGISGILLCCSWTLFKIACYFSSRVDRHLNSLDWDLISLACCCVNETGPLPASDEPSPLLLYGQTKLLCLEGHGLLLSHDVMRPFSELILLITPEPSQHYSPCPLQYYLKQGHWMGKKWALTAQS